MAAWAAKWNTVWRALKFNSAPQLGEFCAKPGEFALTCEAADLLAPPKPRKIKSSSKVTKK